MTDFIAFIETPAGKLQLKAAMLKLSKCGVPLNDDVAMCREDFALSVANIMVPREAIAQVTSPEMVTALANFQHCLELFERNHEDTMLQEEVPDNVGRASGSGGRPAGASASVTIEGSASGEANFRLNPAQGGGSSSGGTAENPAAKRQRLGMSDSDLARACTVIDMPAAKATPQFLADKPLDVRMYTPLLVDLYASVRKVLGDLSLLAREVLSFDGDFLEMSPEAVALLPSTALFATCDLESGSRLFHRLETLHAAAIALRGKNLRCQRAFWLANHTSGCNWDTWEQLCHREEQDAGGDLCNPGFVPLTTWEDQVKAAIVAARQETVALSKDGKTLLGPVLPRLQARHNNGQGSGWRGAKSGAGYRGDKTPPADRAANGRAYHGRGRGGTWRGKNSHPGKENSRRNAASPAAQKPPPAKPATADT